MRILYLGPYRGHFCGKLKEYNDDVEIIEERISLDYVQLKKFDFIISYGYRYIISKDIIDYMQNKIINLHISYLPWNRGADPNFWSFIEDTKKGVTIHLIDECIDTGDIIVQREVKFKEEISLRESYNILTNEVEKLFFENWINIRLGEYISSPQNVNEGSVHFSKEIEKYNHLLVNGWDTCVSKLKNKEMGE